MSAGIRWNYVQEIEEENKGSEGTSDQAGYRVGRIGTESFSEESN